MTLKGTYDYTCTECDDSFSSNDILYHETVCYQCQLKSREKERQKMWKELRDKYFKECVTDGKVNFAAHDLFEWFKRELK